MKQHILLTGATGMLGKDLIKSLLNTGCQVSVLSRKQQDIPGVKVFVWDIYKGIIDPACLEGVDKVIHLAGENIASEPWTEKRKQEIIESRVLSASLLFQIISAHPNKIRHFISASAVGYYGDRDDEILDESSAAGTGFMAECCVAWEKAADKGKELGLKITKIRTGIVLAKDEGALAQMANPVRWFAAAPLGNGKQWLPWIHHRDMTAIYLYTVQHEEIEGVFNACAPFPVTNKTFTKSLAKKLNRPVWPISVPKAVIKLILGEMSAVILNSNNTSVQKILDKGFTFQYTQLDDALADIYS